MFSILVMIWQRRKNRKNDDYAKIDTGRVSNNNVEIQSETKPFADYIRFVFFCVLLIVPVYAIAVSAIRHDWLMMMIDALLVPVGFVHGILLLFGYAG